MMGADFTADTDRNDADSPEDRNRVPVSIGAATRPVSADEPNGDSFVSKSWNDTTLVGVIDGLGHGAPAHEASSAARGYVELHAEDPLASIFRGADDTCSGTRGVVMALAKFDWSADTISFANVGNINVRVAGPEWTGFVVRRGVIGGNGPDASVVTREWDPSHTLAMFSDGISARWEWHDIRNGEGETADAMANRLLERYGKSDDDATALVVTEAND